MFNKPRPEGAGRPSQVIEVTDIKNDITTSYDSMSAAARALNIDIRQISKYFVRNQVKPYKEDILCCLRQQKSIEINKVVCKTNLDLTNGPF